MFYIIIEVISYAKLHKCITTARLYNIVNPEQIAEDQLLEIWS